MPAHCSKDEASGGPRPKTTLLHGSYSDSTGRALLTAVARAAWLAAVMAEDVERYALARRYSIQALDLAMHAGDRLFAANILCSMSYLTIHNTTGRRCARQAVALARDALNTASQVSSGRTVSRIRALQQQIQPLRSAGLSELDEEITVFLRHARDDADITT